MPLAENGGDDDSGTDRRTKDALWLFDALMGLPEPIWLDAKAVAKRKDTKPAQSVTMIRNMKLCWPELSVTCTQGPPGARVGRPRKSVGGGSDGDGDGGGDGEEGRIENLASTKKRGRKPGVKKMQKSVEVKDELGDEGGENGGDEDAEEAEVVNGRVKTTKDQGRKKSAGSDVLKSTLGKAKNRGQLQQSTQAKLVIDLIAEDVHDDATVTGKDEDDADVEDNEVEKEGEDEKDKLARSQPGQNTAQDTVPMLNVPMRSLKRKRSSTLAIRQPDDSQPTPGSARTVGQKMDADATSQNDVGWSRVSNPKPSMRVQDSKGDADVRLSTSGKEEEQIEDIEMATGPKPKHVLPWLRFNPDAVLPSRLLFSKDSILSDQDHATQWED